ncbi:hypothetical protein NXS19_000430 [Fusarium pseudograminearum]|nr:hypothetical protein NXS19_000430 [Fusarium pseudograminearum]
MHLLLLTARATLNMDGYDIAGIIADESCLGRANSITFNGCFGIINNCTSYSNNVHFLHVRVVRHMSNPDDHRP